MKYSTNIFFLFSETKEGKCFMHGVWNLQRTNETMLPMRKSVTISHAQHRTPPIPISVLTKEKEWGCEKMRSKPRTRKSKLRKNRMKESKLVKLNYQIKLKNIKK